MILLYFNLHTSHGVFLTFVVDGEIIPVDPFSGILQGEFNQVPVLLGDVRDDALLFVYQAANGYVTEAEYIGVVTLVFGDHGKFVAIHYLTASQSSCCIGRISST
jgi:hypothetical protein